MSLRSKAGLLVSPMFLGVPWFCWRQLQTIGVTPQGEGRVVLQGDRSGGGGSCETDVSVSPISLLSPPETSAQPSSMQTPSHLMQTVRCGPPTLSATWTHLNPSGDKTQIHPGVPTMHLHPGVISESPNVTGEGIISLFSYLQDRTVLTPSQTDG